MRDQEPIRGEHVSDLGGGGAKGTYVVTDRATSLAKRERALSVFLLRTDRYTVTATIQPDPDGKAIRGSISAMVP